MTKILQDHKPLYTKPTRDQWKARQTNALIGEVYSYDYYCLSKQLFAMCWMIQYMKVN